MPPAEPRNREGRASRRMEASVTMTAPPDFIHELRLAYRFAKVAEDTRNRLMQGVVSFLRVHASGWHPDADKATRLRAAAACLRVVKRSLIEARPREEGGKIRCPLPDILVGVPAYEKGDELYLEAPLIRDMAAPWWRFEIERRGYRIAAERKAESLPGFERMPARGKGFGVWGLVAIVGEAGDLGAYSGCRKLFKRLGLAPNESYPQGEKRTGRKIPRAARGRVMGVIADPLLRKQWRGARKDDGGSLARYESQDAHDPAVIPGEALGPFGAVYGEVKAHALASGKSKGHADKIARRAMVKALLHDVHRAWHGLPLDYDA